MDAANRLELVANYKEALGALRIYEVVDTKYIKVEAINKIYGPYEYIAKSNCLDVCTCKYAGLNRLDLISYGGKLLYTSVNTEDFVAWIVENFSFLTSTYIISKDDYNAATCYEMCAIGEVKVISEMIKANNISYTVIAIGASEKFQLVGLYDFMRNSWIFKPTYGGYSIFRDGVVLEFKGMDLEECNNADTTIWVLRENEIKKVFTCNDDVQKFNRGSNRIFQLSNYVKYINTRDDVIDIGNILIKLSGPGTLIHISDVYYLYADSWFVVDYAENGVNYSLLINGTNDEMYSMKLEDGVFCVIWFGHAWYLFQLTDKTYAQGLTLDGFMLDTDEVKTFLAKGTKQSSLSGDTEMILMEVSSEEDSLRDLHWVY